MCRLRLPRRAPRNVPHESTVTRLRSASSANAISNFPEADFWPGNKVARITESVAARYGALPATTPMLATVSPFFIEGTAQTYRTTPLDGARASHTVLPNRSVT